MRMWAPLAVAGALLMALITGCSSTAVNAGLTEENRRLRDESQRLADENRRLTGERQVMGQEIQQLRELTFKLQQELNAGRREATRIPVDLIEPRYLNPPGGTESWTYRKRVQADLDGDGTAETVTVVNSASFDPATRTVGWDDGHPWHVYVDEPDGTRTVVFARWVQLGRLTVMIGENPRGLIIQQDGGLGTTIYLVTYRGPGQAEAVMLADVFVTDHATFPQDTGYVE